MRYTDNIAQYATSKLPSLLPDMSSDRAMKSGTLSANANLVSQYSSLASGALSLIQDIGAAANESSDGTVTTEQEKARRQRKTRTGMSIASTVISVILTILAMI